MSWQEAFEPYLGRLRALPFVRDATLLKRVTEPRTLSVTEPRAPKRDARVVVHTATGAMTFTAELKRIAITRDIGERLVHLRSTVPELIVFAPLVGRDLAERFAQQQLNFVDLAGNCHLEFGEHYFVHIEGKRPEGRAPSHSTLGPPTYQVLFALLVRPELVTASARTLAEAAGGVSLQTAIDARQRLHEQGLLSGPERMPTWTPVGREAALDLFLTGFSRTLAPSLMIGRFRPRQRDLPQMEAALATRLSALCAWRWGGGAASQRLTGYFRGDTTVVYVDRVPTNLIPELELVPDRHGPLMIAQRPGPLAFEGPLPDTVHPLLAYADLLMDGEDRARDAASEVAARYLPDLAAQVRALERRRR